VSLDEPLAIIDAALQLDIHVSIAALSSVEGIWCKEKRAIVLTSLRPAGRRAFTCAHEIAHCHFGHGSRFDELQESAVASSDSPEESLADQTAAHLLMPLFAVAAAIKLRNWDVKRLTPVQAYILASFFGVSYRGFLSHLHHNLGLIGYAGYSNIVKIAPKDIRTALFNGAQTRNIVFVDEFWKDRPVDAEVGDVILLPHDVTGSGELLQTMPSQNAYGVVAVARAPGINILENLPHSRSLLLRVTVAQFEGFGMYRFPEQNNVYSGTTRRN